jgi:predicted ferric reductase
MSKRAEDRKFERMHVLSGHLQPSEIVPQMKALADQLLSPSSSSPSPSSDHSSNTTTSEFDHNITNINTNHHDEDAIKKNYRRRLHLFRYLLVTVGLSPTVASVLLSVLGRNAREPWKRTISNVAGSTALQLMAMQLVLGARTPLFEREFGFDKIMLAHRKMAYGAMALAGTHIALKAYNRPLSYLISMSGVRGLVYGRVSFWTMCIVALIAIAQRQPVNKGFVPHWLWKSLHYLFYPAIAAAYVHASKMGLRSKSQRTILYIHVAAMVLATLWRSADLLGWVQPRRVFRITKVEQITYDTTQVTLDGNLPRYAGQFGIVRAKSRTGGAVSWLLGAWSEPHPFTISSAPHEPLQFTIKGMPGGKFSTQVHQWKPGQELMVEGPYGTFSPDWDKEDNLVFVAGGVGITPFLSILQDLTVKKRANKRVTLIWGVKDKRDFSPAYWKVFEDAIRKSGTNVKVSIVLVLSTKGALAAAKEDALLWNAVPAEIQSAMREGFVTADLLKQHLVEPNRASYYLCGPPIMTQMVVRLLGSLFHVPESKIHYEYFAW